MNGHDGSASNQKTDDRKVEKRRFELINYLRYFAILAGIFWSATLLFMLLWWVGQGQPNYPVGDGVIHIPYISDVAAFTAKPVFVSGTIISALFYVATIVCLHYVRYDHRFHGSDEKEEVKHGKTWYRSRIASALSIVSVIASGLSLILLAFFDTYRHPNAHTTLLFVLVFSTVFGVGCANVVYYEQIKFGAKDKVLRYSCLAGNVIIILEVCLGIPFILLRAYEIHRPAVVIEWIMGLLMAGYFWSLIGVLGPVRLANIEAGETTPLLHPPTQ